ncbi:hypothetical protein S40288_11534 [Stachybotrys chartarum IBT 40288]|nr:hypothetical protein S40288_11534 [Stachybotrys chartarum IBT 40288]
MWQDWSYTCMLPEINRLGHAESSYRPPAEERAPSTLDKLSRMAPCPRVPEHSSFNNDNVLVWTHDLHSFAGPTASSLTGSPGSLIPSPQQRPSMELRKGDTHSSSVLGWIVRQRAREKIGHPKVTAENLDGNVRIWLARKGFAKDTDIRELERLVGSLIVPSAARRAAAPKRRGTADSLEVGKLRRLRELSGDEVEEIFDEDHVLEVIRHADSEPLGSDSNWDSVLDDPAVTEDSEVIGDIDQLHDLENFDPQDDNSNGTSTRGKESLASTSTLNFPFDQKASTDQKKPPVSGSGAGSRLLPQGQRVSNNHGNQPLSKLRPRPTSAGRRVELKSICGPKKQHPWGVRSWRNEAGVFRDKLYEHLVIPTNSRDGFRQICVWDLRLAIPNDFDLGDGLVRVSIEMCAEHLHHPDRWTRGATHEDIGGCLCLRILYKGSNRTSSIYTPQPNGKLDVYRANSFVDILLHGASELQLVGTPRRF